MGRQRAPSSSLAATRRGAVFVTEERTGQLRIELIDDCGCLQELDHFGRLLIEHLFDEEFGHYTIRSRKTCHERRWIGGVLPK